MSRRIEDAKAKDGTASAARLSQYGYSITADDIAAMDLRAGARQLEDERDIGRVVSEYSVDDSGDEAVIKPVLTLGGVRPGTVVFDDDGNVGMEYV